jgi:hypothetical protein
MVHNIKAQILTKTVFLFLTLVFYAVIFVFVGFAYGDNNTQIDKGNVKDYCFLNICTSNLGFTGQIIAGFNDIPIWINAIIFTPLILTLTFLFITSLPTMSGGS